MQVDERDLIDSGDLQPGMIRILAGTSAAAGTPNHNSQIIHWRAELVRAAAASAAYQQLGEARAEEQSGRGHKRPRQRSDHDWPGTGRRRARTGIRNRDSPQATAQPSLPTPKSRSQPWSPSWTSLSFGS